MVDTSEMEFHMSDPNPTPAPTPTSTPVPTPPPTSSAEPKTDEPVQFPDGHPITNAYYQQKKELAEAKRRLQEIDDANKSDAQKQADRIAALESENAGLKTNNLRAEIAAAKGVPAALIYGATKEDLEASADALVAFRGGQPAPLPGNQRPAGPVSQVQEHEETREDRRKRLAEGLKR